MLKSIIIVLLYIVIAQPSFSSDKVTMPIQYFPTNFSPPMSNDTNGQFILNNIADGLVGWSYREGFFPEVAESWSEKESGNVSFKIRKNIKNFAGNALSCVDIEKIFNLNSSIKGPFFSSYENIIKINCLNKYNLEIKSVLDTKSLLAFLASPQGKIIYIKNNVVIDGIGAYDLKIRAGSIQLLKNKYYYDESRVYLNEINLIVRSDEESLKLYKNGKIDLILLSNLSNAKIDHLPKKDLLSINLWSTWGIAFNQSIKPFNKKELRHCLVKNTKSLDWVSKFYPNDLPAYGPIPFGLIGYKDQEVNYITNYKKNEKDKIEIIVPKEVPNSEMVGSWIENKFSNCVSSKNIKVTIVEFSKMLTLFNQQKMGAYLMSFNKETISDESFFKSFYSQGKENFYSNYSDATRELFNSLKGILPEELKKLSENIALSLAEDAVMVPLMHPVHKVAIRECFKNVVLNPINEGYFSIKNSRNLCN